MSYPLEKSNYYIHQFTKSDISHMNKNQQKSFYELTYTNIHKNEYIYIAMSMRLDVEEHICSTFKSVLLCNAPNQQLSRRLPIVVLLQLKHVEVEF